MSADMGYMSNAFREICFKDRQDRNSSIFHKSMSLLGIRIKQLASRADILVNAPGTWAAKEEIVFGASWHRGTGVMLAERVSSFLGRTKTHRTRVSRVLQVIRIGGAGWYWYCYQHVPARRRIQNWLQLKKLPVERLEDVVTLVKMH